MSKIDELIEKLCPSGVPYINLQAVAEIGTGSSDRKESIENGVYPFYVRSKDILRINKYEFDEIAIVIPGEGGIGEIFHYVVGKYALHQRAYRIHVIDNRLNTKYLYYYMSSMFKDFIMKKAVTATVTSIRKPMIEAFPVAVPPLEIQSEIVYILDKFTALLAELKAELKARKKQYAYYRERILENNETKKVRLRDCLLKVENIKWKQTNESHLYIDLSSVDREKHRILETTEINNTNAPSRAQQIIKKDDVLFGGTRPMLKRSCVVEECYDNEICSTGFCVLRANQSIVLPKWIYYMINTDSFYEYVEKNQQGASYPAISDVVVKDYEISLPTLEEQKKLVELLDKFERYVFDLSEGIPAEIEARQQQYEYYRDKLLTFKELEK